MAQSRIEQIIDELYNYVDSARVGGFNQNRITLQKDELFVYLDDLKLHIPDEIKRCMKIIANRENIMKKAEADAKAIKEEAQEEAKRIIEEGKKQAQLLIEDTEIYNGAYEQAHKMTQEAKEEKKKIINEANAEAKKKVEDADNYQAGVRDYMMNYADDVFSAVEVVLANAYKEARDNSEKLVKVLKENLAKVQQSQDELREAKQNSNSLNSEGAPYGAGSDDGSQGGGSGYYEDSGDDGDYNFPEGTFDPY